MLHQNSNNRPAARGQSADHTRGRGGARGVSVSSGESKFHEHRLNMPPSGPSSLRDKTNVVNQGKYLGKNFDPHYYEKKAMHMHLQNKPSNLMSKITEQASNEFEKERQAHAAQREQRGRKAIAETRGGRGTSSTRGSRGDSTKQSSAHSRSAKEQLSSSANPLATVKSNIPFGASSARDPKSSSPQTTSLKSSTTGNTTGHFAGASKMASPFGQPSKPFSSGGFPTSTSKSVAPNPFAKQIDPQPTASVGFGRPSGPTASNTSFGQPSQPIALGTFGGQSDSLGSFGQQSDQTASGVFGGSTSGSTFGQPSQPTVRGAFGQPSGLSNNKSTTFAEGNQPAAPSGFGKPSVIGGSANNTQANPFGNPQNSSATSNPFTQQPTVNFGQPSSSTAPNPFAKLSSSQSDQTPKSSTSKSFSGNEFRASNLQGKRIISNPFVTPHEFTEEQQSASNVAASSADVNSRQSNTTSSPFGGFSTSPASKLGTAANNALSASNKTNASDSRGLRNTSFSGFSSSPNAPTSGIFPPPSTLQRNAQASSFSGITTAGVDLASQPRTSEVKVSEYSKTLSNHLAKAGIRRPKLPVQDPGNPANKNKVNEFVFGALKTYREKARNSLIAGGLIDDPEAKMVLNDAKIYKGTCEEMCPFKEQLDRILEGSTGVHRLEKESDASGARWPSVNKMVKKFSRSAAGELRPLPEDVRSPAALRRTVDYLLSDTFIQDDASLVGVHDFLWDRTREIRRDFTPMTPCMNEEERLDHVYCLEMITRFHVVTLHQMAKPGVPESQYSEHQERTQLFKTLKSLEEAYTDCRAQNIECENECEFRAYALLVEATVGKLNEIQVRGEKFLESDDITTAVTLVDALQTTFDPTGPLDPHANTDIANTGFIKFFDVVKDSSTSYIMACLAEIHFNNVRYTILKTILSSYRKQRDQTRDWTVSALKQWLQFDDETEVVQFCENHGLKFASFNGEKYMSFDGTQDFQSMHLNHPHSLFVEEKRYGASLLDLMRTTVRDNGADQNNDGLPQKTNPAAFSEVEFERLVSGDYEDSQEEVALFVPDNTKSDITPDQSVAQNVRENSLPQVESEATTSSNSSRPASVFDGVPKVTSFAPNFFSTNLEQSPSSGITLPSQPTGGAPSGSASSIFPTTASTPSAPLASSPFSFLRPSAPDTAQSQQALGEKLIAQASSPAFKPGLSLGKYAVTKSPPGESVASPAEVANLTATPADPVSTPSTSQTPAAPTSLLGFPSGVSTNVVAPTASIASIATPSWVGSQPSASETAANFIGSSSQSSNLPMPPLPLSPAPPAPTIVSDRDQAFGTFTEWFANGEGGIMQDFTEMIVQQILVGAVKQHAQEEAERKAREEYEQAEELAVEYRKAALQLKYSDRWQKIVARARARKERAALKKAREEMAAAARAKKAANTNLVDDFKNAAQSTRTRHQQQIEHQKPLGTLGMVNGVNDVNKAIREAAKPQKKRKQTEKAVEEAKEAIRQELRTEQDARSIKRHKASTQSVDLGRSLNPLKSSDNPLRRSMFDNPSYLSGESRTSMFRNHSPQDQKRSVKGVQTDYFRLKARGIQTVPDGSALASSASTTSLLNKKRSLDGLSKPAPRSDSRPSTYLSTYRRSTSHLSPPPGIDHSSSNRETAADIEALKARARAIVAKDKLRNKRDGSPVSDPESPPSRTSRKRQSFEVDELELFERAKRVREQMDEGSAFYRKELEKDSVRRAKSSGSLENWNGYDGFYDEGAIL